MFTITVPKPGNPRETLKRVKAAIEKEGGRLAGDERSGTIYSWGVEGRYNVGSVITVTITKTPMPFIESIITDEVKNVFAKCAVN